MDAIINLQIKLLDETVSLTSLLRMTFAIAEKLEVIDIISWVKNELNGYNTSWPDADLPEYRKCRAILRGWNPYKGWLPIIFEGEDIDKLVHHIIVYQPVAELEPLKNSLGYLEYPLTGPQEFQIHKWINDTPAMKRLIPNTAIDKILNAVRNIILQWALTLEKQGITGKDMGFTPEEKKIAQTSQAVHIENFFGNFGDISNSQITQEFTTTIEKNNFDTLSEYLSSKGISKEDIANLYKALNEDPYPTSSTKLGKKVSSWLGNMISKAASGVFSIGIDTFTTILVTAINKYYGL
tara:strand:- start:1243 stop:2127 length:885 start_codon:yes stop_codon:yes gene_type:complete